ncbi:MAG: YihY/virulence factor BrkB family protein [Pyrinomonadaceae bacterium]
MNWKFNLRDLFKRLYEKIFEDDVLGNAAQVAFYFTFAIFPLLLFLMSLVGIILNDKEHLQAELFTILRQVMPVSAYELVVKTLTEVTSNASGGKLSFGILLTLWAASAGIDNMRGTLNDIYDLKETRSWIRAKLTSVILTLVIGILLLLALAFMAYGSQMLGGILPIESGYVLESLEWILIVALVLFAVAILYNFAPNHDPFRWKWITPGAVAAVLLWIVATVGFRFYLRYFDSYSATYGSLGAMITLLFWLYLTALVILLGGAINAILDEKDENGNKDKRERAASLRDPDESGKEPAIARS